MSWSADTTGQVSASTNNPITLSYTCGAGTTLLVVALAARTNTARAGGNPTYNSVPMTPSGEGFLGGDEAYGVEVFYMLNPPTGTAYTISVPNTNVDTITLNASSWKGTGTPSKDASNSVDSGAATSTNPSVSVSNTYTNDLALGFVGSGDRDVPSAGTGYTLTNTEDFGNQVYAGEYDLDSGASSPVTVDFTTPHSEDYVIIGILFRDATATPANDSQSAFLWGGIETNDNQIAWLAGGIETSDNQPVYLDSHETANDNISAFLYGQEDTSGQQSGYTRGSQDSSAGLSVYLAAWAFTQASAFGYLAGQDTTSEAQAAYLRGWEHTSSDLSSYAAGQEQLTDQQSAFLHGQAFAPPEPIVAIHLESDLSEFTSTVTDGGDLYWSADAALAGTSGGMALYIQDTDDKYGDYILGTPNTTGVVRARYYFDPNSFTLVGQAYQIMVRSSTPQDLGGIVIGWDTDHYFIYGYVLDDIGGWYDTQPGATLTDAPQYIEFQLTRASTNVSSDGTFSLWIDGVSAGTWLTSIDNYDRFFDFDWVRWGITSVDAGSSGTFYLDELIVNDDGSEIGPIHTKQAYLAGSQDTSDNQTAYLKGEDNTSDNNSAYLVGSINVSDSQYSYLLGSLNTSNNQYAYLEGASAGTDVSDNQYAYLVGGIEDSDTQSAYTHGQQFAPPEPIIAIHLENDLSEFTSTVTDGGDLYWSADAALAGTSGGMACLIDDTNLIYGRKELASSSVTGILRFRFYIDPNSITIPASLRFDIIRLRNSIDQSVGWVVLSDGYGGTTHDINIVAATDGTNSFGSYYEISDEPHYIEVELKRATTNVSADGYMTCWIDGVFQQTLSGLDNYDRFYNFDYVDVGPSWFQSGSGYDGTVYIDELVFNDNGSEIGPVHTKQAYLAGNDTANDNQSAYLSGSDYLPKPFGNAPIVDDFNRASLGSDWTQHVGNLVISNNEATATVSNVTRYYYNAETFGPAIEFIFTIRGLTSASEATYAEYNYVDPSHKYYWYITSTRDTSCTPRFGYYDGAGYQELFNAGSQTYSSTPELRFGVRHEYNGKLSLYMDSGSGWELLGTVNDTTRLYEGYLAINIYSTEIPHTTRDDYRAYTLPAWFVTAYLAGSQDTNDAQSAYLSGGIITSDQQSSYLKGSADDSSYLASYTVGQDYGYDNQAVYLIGWEQLQSSQYAYLRANNYGYSSVFAFLRGSIETTNSASAYSKGETSTSASQSGYLIGAQDTTTNQSAYTHGTEETQTQVSAYTSGGIVQATQQAAYLNGRQDTASNLPAFIEGYSANASSKAAYLKGQDTASSNNAGYLSGGITSSVSVFLVGGISNLDNQAAYIHGQAFAPPESIIAIHLESDLSEFTSVVDDGGDLYWSADAALAGTSGGMACLIDDTTAIYGVKDLGSGNTSGTWRQRLYIDTNGLTMGAGDTFTIFEAYKYASTLRYHVKLKYNSGYYLFIESLNDVLAFDKTAEVAITNAEHYIEFEINRASSDVAGDGSVEWWIDGVAQTSITGIDNYDQIPNIGTFRIGAPSGLDAGTSGTFYLDELIVNDDGSEIGPIHTKQAYLAGINAATDNQTAYLIGSQDTSDSQSAYLSGGTETSSSQSVFVAGSSPWTGEISAYLEGQSGGVSSAQSAFAYGLDSASDQLSAYSAGGIETTSSTFALIIGGIVSNDQLPAYLQGQTSSSSNTPAYLTGSTLANSQISGYLVGQELPASSISAFTKGSAPSFSQAPVYLAGQASAFSNISGYLLGDSDQIGDQSAYLAGQDTITNSTPAYLVGAITSSQSAFTQGHGGYLGETTLNAYLSGRVANYVLEGSFIDDNGFSAVYKSVISLAGTFKTNYTDFEGSFYN